MPSKLAILENVDMYTADELVGYIKSGIDDTELSPDISAAK